MSEIEINKDEASAKQIATLVYALQAIGLFAGVTFIVGVVINYIKRDDVRGTLAESHFAWQIKTFWVSLILSVIGVITAVILIGYLILLANVVFVIYRIAKGWINLNDGKPVY